MGAGPQGKAAEDGTPGVCTQTCRATIQMLSRSCRFGWASAGWAVPGGSEVRPRAGWGAAASASWRESQGARRTACAGRVRLPSGAGGDGGLQRSLLVLGV